MNTSSTEYRILGYSSSEIEVHAKPFLIVLKIHGQLKGYLLEDWRDLVGCSDPLDAMYIDDIVQDLRDQVNGWNEGLDGLFNSMSELCVGPVRTIRSGIVAQSSPELPEPEGVVECSRETMMTLVNSFGRLDHHDVIDQVPKEPD